LALAVSARHRIGHTADVTAFAGAAAAGRAGFPKREPMGPLTAALVGEAK